MDPRPFALAVATLAALSGGCGGDPAATHDGGDALAPRTDATTHDAAVLDVVAQDQPAVDAAVAPDAVAPVICTAGALACASSAVAAVCNGDGTAWAHTTPCPAGARCEAGECVGPIAWHLRNSVDLQFVQGKDPSVLAACAAMAPRQSILCDVDHLMHATQPRFGLFFGNGWTSLDPASANPCVRPTTAFACISANLRRIADHWHADNPSLLLAGEMAEFIAQTSVPAAQWPSICRAGSIGQWGANTCIPDLEHSTYARDYMVAWGQAFVDGGVRAFSFGELPLMTGTLTGAHTVAYDGAAGLNDVITRIRAYAATRGIHTLYFGAQAASSVTLRAGGPEIIDFIEGAQHLEAVGGYLLQPLLASGGFENGRYSAGDGHEANLANDANGLPVLLDYDNWSASPTFPDDIRYIASVADDAARARVLMDHWRHLRNYNPRASLSIPASKTLANDTGVTCEGINGYVFAAADCGLTAATLALFNEADDAPMTAAAGAPSPPIRPSYWGQQLRGRDETVSWYYLAFLGRRVSTPEYTNALAGLPPLMAADGARCGFAAGFVNSAEFAARHLTDADFVAVVMRALLLREPDAAGTAYFAGQLGSGANTRAGVLAGICGSAEATALYAAP